MPPGRLAMHLEHVLPIGRMGDMDSTQPHPARGPTHADLRRGVTELAVLSISKREVLESDLQSVLDRLKVFSVSREDVALYRGQISLHVAGYDDDPRELVDIPEVRAFLRRLADGWPYWAYFLCQVDHSLLLLASCAAGGEFPGNGSVIPDPKRFPLLLQAGFDGMNELWDRFGFLESENEAHTKGLLEALGLG